MVEWPLYDFGTFCTTFERALMAAELVTKNDAGHHFAWAAYS